LSNSKSYSKFDGVKLDHLTIQDIVH
jgi:hypothetical protein